jgi:hypothetical protein
MDSESHFAIGALSASFQTTRGQLKGCTSRAAKGSHQRRLAIKEPVQMVKRPKCKGIHQKEVRLLLLKNLFQYYLQLGTELIQPLWGGFSL